MQTGAGQSSDPSLDSAKEILRSNAILREASTETNWYFSLHCVEAILIVYGAWLYADAQS